MFRYELRERIDRPPQAVFDFVGTRYLQNHPRWEPAVREVRQTTAGPLRPGARTVMVRQDAGRVHEVPHEVVEFVPGRAFAMRTLGGLLGLSIAFATSPAGPSGTDLTVRVAVEPHGLLKLLQPLLALQMPRAGARMVRRIKELVEAEP
ncbi:MAG TPA: SRPBCC family protein [Chloroflexota bacterium]|jgi:uncharacterized protein YndB with AHSA1/START domain|nr:SRPBCC family protein [Chloroflexota bacterium]